MVSISFGKSNFSEIQNSYQMTVALVMMFVVLCSISSIIVAVKTSSSQEPVPIKREDTKPASQDVAAKKESKVKITNDGIQFPKPPTTEGYLSEGVSCKKLQNLETSAYGKGRMDGGVE